MRVMCINDNWTATPEAAKLPRPAFGDIDEVIDTEYYFGAAYYELQRFPDLMCAAEMFAPLSDEPAEVIEEKELDHATA